MKVFIFVDWQVKDDRYQHVPTIYIYEDVQSFKVRTYML